MWPRGLWFVVAVVVVVVEYSIFKMLFAFPYKDNSNCIKFQLGL